MRTAEFWNQVFDFAENLANTIRMRRYTAVKSIKMQFGISTREARKAFDVAKTPKHRRRSK